MYVDLYQFWSLKSGNKILDYAKNLQAKYFIGENIPIYGIIIMVCWWIYHHVLIKPYYCLFSFSRSIKGSSPTHDLDLDDDYYLMYGLGATLTTSTFTR